MKSMTGFGRQDYRDDRIDISVEIKTVNHRYKDFFIKMPRTLGAHEEKVRKTIGEVLNRGRIEVYIKFNHLGAEEKTVVFNDALATAYIDVLANLKAAHPQIEGPIQLDLVAKFPDVVTVQEEQPDDDANWLALKPVLEGALAQVSAARVREGAAMKADMAARCDTIATFTKEIEKLAPEMLTTYQENLTARITELLGDVKVDEQRLLTEVAVMADKLAIDEELTRLNTHIGRLRELLEIESEPVGRKLDFLIQELNREINTIGSKSNDVRIANIVVDVKAEIEKIREQVQNIE